MSHVVEFARWDLNWIKIQPYHFFHLTCNRVIAAVRTNWKIRQGVLIFAISCSTFKVQEAVIIVRTMSFLYSTLTSDLRWTTFPCLCVSVPCPIASNWNFYKNVCLKYCESATLALICFSFWIISVTIIQFMKQNIAVSNNLRF